MEGAIAPRAADLSPDEAEARSQRCFEIDAQIKSGLRAGREAMWDVARGLHEFDEENGWTALGIDSLGEWLADPEVGMTRATYFRMVKCHRFLIEQKKLAPARVAELELSKVEIVLPKLKAGSVKMDDALADVQHLGARDLREKYMRRPDPADLDPPPDPNGVEASRPPADPPIETPDAPPTPNVGDGGPVRASDGAASLDEPEVLDGTVVEEPIDEEPDPMAADPLSPEPAQNDHDESSGPVPVNPTGPSAEEVVEWIDRGLNRDASAAMRRHALMQAKTFIVALFPQLAETAAGNETEAVAEGADDGS
jgi:hypothetical protein